ncbi:MAG: hypothetical protein SVM79_03330, partial [Chloroflexota bacterium]|nr:hypothetical protein [Chloroflexota bacterium]
MQESSELEQDPIESSQYTAALEGESTEEEEGGTESESTLCSESNEPQAGDPPLESDEAEDGPSELEKEDARISSILLRALEAVFILVASLLLLIKIPYFPVSFSVVASFTLAILSYKNSAYALLALFILAMPGYIYQGGFPPLMVGIVFGVLFICAATCIGVPGASLGIAAGTIAAMLMFTPLYFAAVPLFVGVALFRARGTKVGNTEAILVFVVLYLPFLIGESAITSPDALVPLFQQVDFAMRSPTPIVEVTEFYHQIGDSLGTNSHIIDNLSIYFPIHADGRLLGFVLILSLVAAVAAAYGAFALIDWFKERLEDRRHLSWWAPTFALLIASMAFLLPILILKSAFVYSVGLGIAGFLGFIGMTVIIGNLGSVTEYWMTHRERLLDLRFQLENLTMQITELNNTHQEHIAEIESICPDIDLFSEKFTGKRTQQELDFVLNNIDAMDAQAINEKLKLLDQVEREISLIPGDTSRKLFEYVDDSRQKNHEFLIQASEFGLSPNDAGNREHLIKSDFADDESAMTEQIHLNDAFKNLAESLVSAGIDIGHTIKEEVDPEFIAISIAISQNHLNSGNYQDAIDTLLGSLATVERMVANSLFGLTDRMDLAIKRLQLTIRTAIVPAIEATNDATLASQFNEEFVKLQRLRFSAQPGSKLVDLLEVVKVIRELSDWTTSIIRQLFAKINELADEIDSKVPSGYTWGALPRGEDMMGRQSENDGKASLSISMTAIELAIQNIELEAEIIKQYMTVREFVINYPNIEYLLEEQLRTKKLARVEEVP